MGWGDEDMAAAVQAAEAATALPARSEVFPEALPEVEAAPAAEPEPAPRQAEPHEIELDLDEVFVLDMDADDEPSSLVKPPPDMLSGTGSRLGSAWSRGEESAAAPAVEEAPAPALAETEIDLGEIGGAAQPLYGLEAFDADELPPLEAGEIELDLDADLPPLDASIWAVEMEPAPASSPAALARGVAPPTGGIDHDLLERTAAELQPEALARDEDLVSEAEVLAKYGLEEKAMERLEEALRIQPRNLGAHAAMVQIQLDKGRLDRVVELANAFSRAAAEARDTVAWPKMRRQLVEAGFRMDGDRVVADPHAPVEAPPPPPPPVAAAPPPPPPAPVAAAPGRPSSIWIWIWRSWRRCRPRRRLSKCRRRLRGAAPSGAGGAQALVRRYRSRAARPARAQGQAAGRAAPSPRSAAACAPPRPTPSKRRRSLLRLRPRPPRSAGGAGDLQSARDRRDDRGRGRRLGAADRRGERRAALPDPAAGPAAAGRALPQNLDDTGGMSWLDEADRNRPAQDARSESLFDEEDDFFDLAAELEQELSQEDLFKPGEMLCRSRPSSRWRRSSRGSRRGSPSTSRRPTTTPTSTSASPTARWASWTRRSASSRSPPRTTAISCSAARCSASASSTRASPSSPSSGTAAASTPPASARRTTSACSTTSAAPTWRVDDKDSAYKVFVELYGINNGYRDVVARIEELGR